MPTLKEIQSAFIDAIYENNTEAIFKQISTDKISKEEHLQVYKDNVLITLYDTMKLRYPIICKLVDESFFKYAVNEYIIENKSISGNLNDYGKNFIDFLTNFPPTKELKYLPDIAKIEWAIHLAYFAADAQPINRKKLSKVPQEQYENLKFTFAPSAQLISSKYPINKIWQAAQDDYKGDFNININEGGQYTLIIRPQYKTNIIPIEESEYAFLSALKSNKTLSQAYEAAIKTDKNFDLSNAIQKFSLNGTFVDFTVS